MLVGYNNVLIRTFRCGTVPGVRYGRKGLQHGRSAAGSAPGLY